MSSPSPATSSVQGVAANDETEVINTLNGAERHHQFFGHPEIFAAMSRQTWTLFEHFQACGYEVTLGTRQRNDSAGWAQMGDTFSLGTEDRPIEVFHQISLHKTGTVVSVVSLFRSEGFGSEGTLLPRELLYTSMDELGSLDWSAARVGDGVYRRSQLLEQLTLLTLLDTDKCMPAARMAKLSDVLEP